MEDIFYLKLRANIFPGDIELAKREIEPFFQEIHPVNKPPDLKELPQFPRDIVTSNTRPKSPIGFIGKAPRAGMMSLVQALSFVQEIWSVTHGLDKSYQSSPWLAERSERMGRSICRVPLMAAAEFLSYFPTDEPAEKDLKAVVNALCYPNRKHSKNVTNTVFRANTSAPHVHSLHKYKAKFFPRMIRSFLIRSLPDLPKRADGELLILDPFVGSGTTLVEASLLGFQSIGIDIDHLSCAISQTKIDVLLGVNPTELQDGIDQLKITVEPPFDTSIRDKQEYAFPPWIARKFERWGSPEEKKQYEVEIARWADAISQINPESTRGALRICLSDAISRKFNIRMMGTGVGRFALEIRKSKLSSIMESNLRGLLKTSLTCKAIREAYQIKPVKSIVLQDTATAMPICNSSVSLVLTSPPYLPASSGRENYLVGKSISTTALGLMTVKEIQEADSRSVGSMHANGKPNLQGLPLQVQELYKWLKADELRAIKAGPTVAYYRDLSKALRESYRVLLPGGLAIYVIGKASVFYRFSTREVLYRVSCDDIFAEIAQESGFILEDRMDVKLNKRNRNARPRSLDDYFETVFLLRKADKNNESTS